MRNKSMSRRRKIRNGFILDPKLSGAPVYSSPGRALAVAGNLGFKYWYEAFYG